MKTNEKDFELFKTECKKWMDVFELHNYQYRFEHKKQGDGNNAASIPNSSSCTNTLCLAVDVDYGKFEEERSKEEYIKNLAKHEMIHSLLGRFSTNAQARYVNKNELREAEEELVVKLEKII